LLDILCILIIYTQQHTNKQKITDKNELFLKHFIQNQELNSTSKKSAI